MPAVLALLPPTQLLQVKCDTGSQDAFTMEHMRSLTHVPSVAANFIQGSMPAARSLASSSATLFLRASTSLSPPPALAATGESVDEIDALGLGASAGRGPDRTWEMACQQQQPTNCT